MNDCTSNAAAVMIQTKAAYKAKILGFKKKRILLYNDILRSTNIGLKEKKICSKGFKKPRSNYWLKLN